METIERHTILVITGDPERGDFLTDQLEADGFDVVIADDVAMGGRALQRAFPDLVIVDARLPDGAGVHIVTSIRAADASYSRVDPATPVLLLAENQLPLDRIRALDRGADDAMALPLDYPELVARVRALLRRAAWRGRKGMVRIGPLQVDPVSRDVRIGDAPIELSQKEFLLLQVLASEPTRVFSKEELLRAVWGMRPAGRTRTLDSHACRLRQKLRAQGVRFVVNVWGVGYRLVDGPLDAVDVPPLSLVQAGRGAALPVAA